MKLSEELRRLLREANPGASEMRQGCAARAERRQGRGDHEIWRSSRTGALLVVDDGMKSRHIANRVLKAAGLPKAF